MRLLSLCPRITKKSGKISAITSLRLRILLLGLIIRKVVIDMEQKRIVLDFRYAWFIRRRRSIAFGSIDTITYGYEDFSPGSMFSVAHDSVDWFTVGLRLKDDSELLLFNFIGDGTFYNSGPLPDWLYWDEQLFDLTGSQTKESRAFVDLLANLTGASVGAPRSDS